MKKLVFILFLLSNGIVLNAQTKPTKQETIDWLTAQIRKYSVYINSKEYGSDYTYSITDDYQIECTQEKTSRYFSGTTIYKIAFSFNDVCEAYFSVSNGIAVKFKKPIKYVNDTDGSSFKVDAFSLQFEFGNESNMKERMLKAFKTLAEYNGPPAKNTF